MKRLLFLMLACACVLGTRGAVAATHDQPELNDSTPFPRVEAVIDSTYRGRMKVVGVKFIEGFSPGGSRDLPAADIQAAADLVDHAGRGQDIVFIGATDPMRFHDSGRKLTQIHNYTLGLTRANWLKQQTGSRGVVSTDVLLNDRRGVYVVMIERREGAERPAAAPYRAETLPGAMASTPEVFFSPHVAIAYVRAGDMDYTAPQIGIGVRKGHYSILTSYGRTFKDPDDNRVQTAGLRIGDDFGLFTQIMFVDARKLIPYFDQYTFRAVGGTIGAGYGWHPYPVDVVINGGIGPFDAVTPDELKNHWEFGFNLGLSLGFTF